MEDKTGWDAHKIDTVSDTHLEDDQGEGDAAIIRCFEFKVNKRAFKERPPSKQELFDSHRMGIEVMLWKDGMQVMPEIDPRVTMNKRGTKYRIFIGAKPAKGHLLMEVPKTLSEIAHGRTTR